MLGVQSSSKNKSSIIWPRQRQRQPSTIIVDDILRQSLAMEDEGGGDHVVPDSVVVNTADKTVEPNEEDVDVVLKKTELGKYLASPDVTSAVPYDVFQDEPDPGVGGSMSSQNTSFVSNYQEDDSSDDGCTIFIDSELIQSKFTREYRLVYNSRYFVEKTADLVGILKKIECYALALSKLKQDTPERKDIVENLVKLKIELQSQLSTIQHLISVEDTLLEQITQPIHVMTNQSTLGIEKLDLSPEPLAQSENLVQTPGQDSGTFESDTTTTGNSPQNSTDADAVGQDEVYEANEMTESVDGDDAAPTDDSVDKEFIFTQQIVLDELKKSLDPRRVDMANREREAYIRAYGNPPSEGDMETDPPTDSREKVSNYLSKNYGLENPKQLESLEPTAKDRAHGSQQTVATNDRQHLGKVGGGDSFSAQSIANYQKDADFLVRLQKAIDKGYVPDQNIGYVPDPNIVAYPVYETLSFNSEESD